MRRYLDGELDKPYPRQQNLTELAGDDAEADAADDPDLVEPETDGGAAAAPGDASLDESMSLDSDAGPDASPSADEMQDATQDLIDAGPRVSRVRRDGALLLRGLQDVPVLWLERVLVA